MEKYLLMIFMFMLMSCMFACDVAIKDPIDEKLMCEENGILISIHVR